MLEPRTLITGFLAIFLAGLSYGLTGFGFALVATPLLVLFLPPRQVMPLVLLLSVLTGCVVLYDARRYVQPRRIWLLTLAGLLGTPLGTWLLVACPLHVLKGLIGLVTIGAAVALLLGLSHPIADERLACPPIGFLSGLLNGSTGMSGPPVILFFANQGVDKQICRANLTAYFMALNAFTVPSYLLAGLITRPVLAYTGLFVPALALGVLAGIRLVPHVPDRPFRLLTLLIVLAAGVLSLASGPR